jgi:GNAT superfamily N-acetyltransferase
MADLDDVLALAREFVTSFELDEVVFRSSFSELLDTPNTYFAVATRDDRVIGYLLGSEHLTIYANGRVAWVDEIMVGEEYRRQGIGEQLMSGLEAWAQARGCVLATLATRRAAPFYLTLGYEESATYFKKVLK